METENRAGLGPTIGTVIILLIIIVGGLYFWMHRAKTVSPAASGDQAATAPADTDVQAVSAQSSSDDTASIQSDLNATNVDTIDSSIQ